MRPGESGQPFRPVVLFGTGPVCHVCQNTDDIGVPVTLQLGQQLMSQAIAGAAGVKVARVEPVFISMPGKIGHYIFSRGLDQGSNNPFSQNGPNRGQPRAARSTEQPKQDGLSLIGASVSDRDLVISPAVY